MATTTRSMPAAKGGPPRAASYEKSAADRKADRAGARKAGTSVKKYEGSPADMKADAAAMRKMRRGRR
jgi:hypothetical protein